MNRQNTHERTLHTVLCAVTAVLVATLVIPHPGWPTAFAMALWALVCAGVAVRAR